MTTMDEYLFLIFIFHTAIREPRTYAFFFTVFPFKRRNYFSAVTKVLRSASSKIGKRNGNNNDTRLMEFLVSISGSLQFWLKFSTRSISQTRKYKFANRNVDDGYVVDSELVGFECSMLRCHSRRCYGVLWRHWCSVERRGEGEMIYRPDTVTRTAR